MMFCNGCGGVVGRDCYNPQECEHITQQMEIGYSEYAIRAEMQQQLDDLRAQLAAAEARALPELPSGAFIDSLKCLEMEPEFVFKAQIYREPMNRFYYGSGPTPAEAIRNAVAQIDNAAVQEGE